MSSDEKHINLKGLEHYTTKVLEKIAAAKNEAIDYVDTQTTTLNDKIIVEQLVGTSSTPINFATHMKAGHLYSCTGTVYRGGSYSNFDLRASTLIYKSYGASGSHQVIIFGAKVTRSLYEPSEVGTTSYIETNSSGVWNAFGRWYYGIPNGATTSKLDLSIFNNDVGYITSADIPEVTGVLKQVEELPEPSAELADTILMYVGETTNSYIKGDAYQCMDISDPNEMMAPLGDGYAWINLNNEMPIMPLPSKVYLNRIITYIGETNDSYVKGDSYKCVAYSGGTAYTSYYWVDLNNELLIMPSKTFPIGYENRIVRYIGTTNDDYINGRFYEWYDSMPGMSGGYSGRMRECTTYVTSDNLPSLTGYATESYVNTQVAELVDSAPETLNTLNELATAIQENDAITDALNSAIGNKADKTELNNYLPLVGGTMSGPLNLGGYGLMSTGAVTLISSGDTTTGLSLRSGTYTKNQSDISFYNGAMSLQGIIQVSRGKSPEFLKLSADGSTSANKTFAFTDDINNATLTIQKNGTSVGTFTANASSNSTINITVPTGAAADKGVVTAIDTSANLPTSNAVKTFVEGKGYITSSGSITGNAATATKATQDGSGNVITSTYLPLSGGTISANSTITFGGTTNATGAKLKWGTVGSNTPYFGYASDQSDGTFVWSLKGTAYATGLAIGGGSGNLLWKGVKVATTDDLAQFSVSGHTHAEYVTLSTTQTISGTKTFTGTVYVPDISLG